MSGRFCFTVVLVALMAAPVMAQEQTRGGGANTDNAGGNNGGGNNGGGRGGRGNFDPAQFRQQMEDRLKEQLGTNDDEWKVIQPKLEKVFDAQRASRGGFGGFGRGGRNRGGDNNTTNSTAANDQRQRGAVETAQRDLQQLLDNKDATPEQLAAKVKALRDAREKAKEELASAQKDLKEILTPRQEAVLVNMGMLD